MVKIETALEELEDRIISYENFKQVLQQYLQRLLSSDQDTLAVVAEMLDTVKSLSAARELGEAPLDIPHILQLRPEALYRYGGVAFVESTTGLPLLRGGTIKIDDPQVYGMSLISTWLDCMISNPEQSLDSLRKVFLRATGPWGADLNRIFHIDLGRIEAIAAPESWLAGLLRGEPVDRLHLARVTNVVQALGMERPTAVGQIPLPAWRHLLLSRPVYDLTSRFAHAGRDTARARLVALRREVEVGKSLPCLYRVGLDPMPPLPDHPAPITIGDLQATLGCALATPVRLEMIERADHLNGSAPATFSASLPLGNLPHSFSMILNQPEEIVIQDIPTSDSPPAQRLLRVASRAQPEQAVRLFRLHTLPQKDWPSQQGWARVYRFYDLSDIGVTTCPSEAYLEVRLLEGEDREEDESQIYFHRWGETRASLRISAMGLHRTAQTGTLILLHTDEETALDVLDSLQGLIGPAAQEIDPIVSDLECVVRWRHRTGTELFRGD